MKKIILLMILFSAMSFGTEFWELGSYKVSVKETIYTNQKNKVKNYNMKYSNKSVELYVTSPEINKGEKYTYKNNKKTVYYPKLDKTQTKTFTEDEANILNVLNNLSSIDKKKTYTKNGNTYTFKDNKITSIKSKNYNIYFVNYTSSSDISYPQNINIYEDNKQIISYRFSDFKKI